MSDKCICGLDNSPEGVRFSMPCPKHDSGFAEKSAISLKLPALTYENIVSMLRPEFSDYAPLLLDIVAVTEAAIKWRETDYEHPDFKGVIQELIQSVDALLQARKELQ